MAASRSGPLAAWAAAFFAGRVGVDQVVDAVSGTDAPHQVAGVPDLDVLRDVLVAWRRAGGGIRLVLPVAGDVRGLPGPAAFRGTALECGEAVVGTGLGVVPEVVEYAPSSAPPSVFWRAFAIESVPPDFVSLADAEYELGAAIRETATALSAAGVAGATADVAEALHGARRAGSQPNLPPGFPPRAVALVAQAERLQAVLDVALADPIGGAVDRAGIAARTAALRPLAMAVRRARVAAYNAEARA